MMRPLFLILLVGCGTQKKVVPDSGPVGDAGDPFASQYARAVCDSIEGCCQKNHFKLARSTCLTVVAGEEQQRINEAAARGKQVIPGAMDRCLAETRATFQACPTTDWVAAQAKLLAACDLWSVAMEGGTGTKPPGASCTTSEECSLAGCSSGGCFGQTGSKQCVCHHPPVEGKPCSGPEVWDCIRTPDGSGETFTLFRGWWFQQPTRWSLYCDIAADGGPTCAPTLPVGSTCDPLTATAAWVPACGGATCDAMKACSFAPVGAPCGHASGTHCDEGLYCDLDQTCQAKRPTGEPCGRAEFTGRGCTGDFCDHDVHPDGGIGQCVASPFAPFYVCGAL